MFKISQKRKFKIKLLLIKPNYLEELVLKKLEMLQLMKTATDQKVFKFHLENLKKMKL